MRILLSIATLLTTLYGVWWITGKPFDLDNKVDELLHTGSFHTLEIRHSANHIMETHRTDLLKDNRHKYLEPVLKFYPYLLLEVKYTLSDEKTKEGVILWDLTDGEMVIDTKAWEKTHGFGDCINAHAERQEFKILNILAKKGGSCDREALSKALHIENEILDAWLDSCRRKKLIVQTGNRYRLHLQNPKLRTDPETKLEERLVTKPHRNAIRTERQFSFSQVERISKAAFGNDFTIRKTTDLYLPVHCISVQNPDGSIHTTLWNALNGKLLSNKHFVH